MVSNKVEAKLKVIDEYKSEEMLSKHLDVVESFSFTLNEFKQELEVSRYPIFVKIISNKAVHKVKSGALFEFFSEQSFVKQKPLILRRAKQLKSNKIVIQEKIYGKEFIFGIKDDEKFGKLLMIGIGGRLAEQLKDVSFRVIPIRKTEFFSMLNDLKNQAMLSNLNKDKLWLFTSKLIAFANKHKEIAFIDLNPVIIESDTKKPIIVDARIYTK